MQLINEEDPSGFRVHEVSSFMGATSLLNHLSQNGSDVISINATYDDGSESRITAFYVGAGKAKVTYERDVSAFDFTVNGDGEVTSFEYLRAQSSEGPLSRRELRKKNRHLRDHPSDESFRAKTILQTIRAAVEYECGSEEPSLWGDE